MDLTLTLLKGLHEESIRIGDAYSDFIIVQGLARRTIISPEGIVSLRDVMDKAYICSMTILESMADVLLTNHLEWQVLSTVAAKLFSVMANISFCSVPQLDMASSFTSKVLPILQSSPDGCLAILNHLPCYADVIKAVPAPPPLMSRWQRDHTLVSKVLIILPAATSCLQSCTDFSQAVSKLLPFAFLLLRHPEVWMPMSAL